MVGDVKKKIEIEWRSTVIKREKCSFYKNIFKNFKQTKEATIKKSDIEKG